MNIFEAKDEVIEYYKCNRLNFDRLSKFLEKHLKTPLFETEEEAVNECYNILADYVDNGVSYERMNEFLWRAGLKKAFKEVYKNNLSVGDEIEVYKSGVPFCIAGYVESMEAMVGYTGCITKKTDMGYGVSWDKKDEHTCIVTHITWCDNWIKLISDNKFTPHSDEQILDFLS